MFSKTGLDAPIMVRPSPHCPSPLYVADIDAASPNETHKGEMGASLMRKRVRNGRINYIKGTIGYHKTYFLKQ